VTAFHRSYGPWDLVIPEDRPLSYPAAGAASTLADGTYSIPRLTNDAWRIKFEECHGPVQDRTYRTEWYDDQATSATAKIVETRYGQDRTGIDAVLSPIL
jgi:hypothetical protein